MAHCRGREKPGYLTAEVGEGPTCPALSLQQVTWLSFDLCNEPVAVLLDRTHRWCVSCGHGGVKQSGWWVLLLCLQILLRAFPFFVVLLVLFFLINDSFLAFVTSSSLLVGGTTQSSRHLLPALPVPEDWREDPVSRQGHLWLWFISVLEMSRNWSFHCPQNSEQPLDLVKTKGTLVCSLLIHCTSSLALQDANG